MPGPEGAPRKLSPQEQLAALHKKDKKLSKQMRKYSPNQEGFAQLFLQLEFVRSEIERLIDSISSDGPSPLVGSYGLGEPEKRMQRRRPKPRKTNKQ